MQHDGDVLEVEWDGEAWDKALGGAADIEVSGGRGDRVLHRPRQLLVDVAARDDDRVERLLRRTRLVEDDEALSSVARDLGLELREAGDGAELVELVDALRRAAPRAASLHGVLVADPQRAGGTDSAKPAPRPDDIPGADAEAGRGITVAVLDTGIDAKAGLSVLTGAAEAEVPDADGDRALDWAAGHGTHVAGIVSRHAGGAALHVDRVLDTPLGVAGELEVARALLAAARGAQVINCSFGGASLHDAAPLVLERAIARLPRGTVVVAAAGNQGLERPHWPAALKHVVAVGAVGRRKEGGDWLRADFSNFGGWVDCCAPGVGIQSTFLEFAEAASVPGARRFERGASWSGTSFATPAVSGAIAALAAREGITAMEAAQRLVQTAPRSVAGVGALLA